MASISRPHHHNATASRQTTPSLERSHL